jgi:hypothetical protein
VPGVKRSQPPRDWTLAREKCESGCRLCGDPAEAAHIIGRSHDSHEPIRCPEWVPFTPWLVAPDRILPLCRAHHTAYDSHQLDVLAHLTPDEQVQAVADAGSLELARRRLLPSEYRQPSLFAPLTREAGA